MEGFFCPKEKRHIISSLKNALEMASDTPGYMAQFCEVRGQEEEVRVKGGHRLPVQRKELEGERPRAVGPMSF